MASPMNMLEQKFQTVQAGINEHWKAPQDHFDYGIITAVDLDTYQVKVKLHGRDKGSVLPDRFLPLLTQREVLFMLWGQLRVGLTVRVHWRGQPDRADWALVEVVAGENADFLKQLDMDNEIPTGPHLVTQGGVIPT